MKWVSWTNFGPGIWLIAAPFALAYSQVSSALYEDVLLGVLIASFALSRALGEHLPSGAAVSWCTAAGGLWVMTAPFVLGYSGTTAAAYNDVSAGLLVLLLASWQAVSRPQAGLRQPGGASLEGRGVQERERPDAVPRVRPGLPVMASPAGNEEAIRHRDPRLPEYEVTGFHVHAVGWVLIFNSRAFTPEEARDVSRLWGEVVSAHAEDLGRAPAYYRFMERRSVRLSNKSVGALARLVRSIVVFHPERFGWDALRRRRNAWAFQALLGFALFALAAQFLPRSWPLAAEIIPTLFLMGWIAMLPAVLLSRAATAVKYCSEGIVSLEPLPACEARQPRATSHGVAPSTEPEALTVVSRVDGETRRRGAQITGGSASRH